MLCMFAPVIANSCVYLWMHLHLWRLCLCLWHLQCISVYQRQRVPRLTDISMWNMSIMWSMLSMSYDIVLKHVSLRATVTVKNYASNMIIDMQKPVWARRRRHIRAYVSAWMITLTNIHVVSKRIETSEERIKLSWYMMVQGDKRSQENKRTCVYTNKWHGAISSTNRWPQAFHRNHTY